MTYKANASAYVEHLRKFGITCLYHFTSRRNLESIKRNGGLYSWWSLDRRGIAPSCPGGDSLSRQLDLRYGLEDYVRLSLCPDHPMAYRLKQRGEDIVVLRVSLDVVELADTMFSDMNAADSAHTHGSGLEDLKRINIRATQRQYVRREDPDFKLKQAEVMSKTIIPSRYIMNLDCA